MSVLPRLRPGLYAALCALSACNYDSADSGATIQMNTCASDAHCENGAECRDGMCVAQSADAPLTIALQVTPVRTGDGGDPAPIILKRFLVEGPMSRTFELPERVAVRGTVRNGGVPIDAELTFAPMELTRGFASRMVTASVSANMPAMDADFNVQLLRDLAYRVTVRPIEHTLPPHTAYLTAIDGEELNIEYAELTEGRDRTFMISGPHDQRSLLVRAFDAVSGELVSSTATVTDGRAVLKFADDKESLRIEIRAERRYDPERPEVTDPATCDVETPDFPVFSLLDETLERDGDVTLIELPAVPPRIRFEGTVGLCRRARDVTPADTLPITLHARSLLASDGSEIPATYDATTTARLDTQTGEMRFCVEVIPGDYDVLASPASSMPCSLYAERRPIAAPPSGGNASGALLQLPEPVYLRGTLKTVDRAPVRGASIDAVALGRSGDIELDAADASVTRYNRSRQTASDDEGNFEVAVDLGTYDLMAKPPTGSGFSWQVLHDVQIGARDATFSTAIEMLSPVAVEGRLRARDATLVDGAEIAAFAIIRDKGADGAATGAAAERAVPIGRATADTSGRFTLLLPPSIHDGWYSR